MELSAPEVEFAQLKSMNASALLHEKLAPDPSLDGFGDAIPGIGTLKTFEQELRKWRPVFVGKSKIVYLHAGVIVAIRRKIELQSHLSSFFELWDVNATELLRQLNLKWLVSAADTVFDYGRDEAERNAALAALLFVKTVKLYETEIRAKGSKDLPVLDFERKVLFDEYLNYAVTGGDLVRNLKGRVESVKPGKFADELVKEVFRRVMSYDTAFTRLP